MKRRQKLLISVCAPTVAAVALGCGAAGLVLGLKKHDGSSDKHFKDAKTITFDPGIGHFANKNHTVEKIESGTTLDRVAQPQVVLPEGKYFAGWKTLSGALCNGKEVIKNDMTLTASNGTLTSDYALVRFQVPSYPEGVIIQGNVTCIVKKGYQFYMVNRPQASFTDESGKEWYFKNWRYAQSTSTHEAGEEVKESDEISEDVILEPKFTRAVTVEWHPCGYQDGSTSVEASIERGSNTTTLESGSEFGQFNQPELKCADGSTTEYYFAGWYKVDPRGYTEEELKAFEWDESAPVEAEDETDTFHAYARWSARPAPSSRYASVGFNTPVGFNDGDFTISPSDTVLVEKGTNWGNTNKPKYVAFGVEDNYRISSWQMTTDVDETTGKPNPGAEWNDLSDSYVFNQSYFAVRPIMVEAVDSVTISATTTTPLPEAQVQCTAIVKGGAESQEVTWNLYSDPECTVGLDTSIAAINQDGTIEVKSLDYSTTFYVQATASITLGWETPVKSAPIQMTVKLPYADSSDVWFHYQVDDDNYRWFKLSVDDICDETQDTMVASPIGSGVTPLTIDKTDSVNLFTTPIYFGDQIISIKSNFARNWKSFNSYLKLADSNVKYISSGFLSGCTNWNNGVKSGESTVKPLDLSGLTVIGDGFMTGCSAFNQPVSFVSSKEGFVSTLTNIGQDFLDSCSTFNSSIILPDEESQSIAIEQGFLIHCTAFNQPITFPNSVKYIGNFCMNGCNYFTNTITINCPTSAFTGSDGDFVGNASNTPIAETGFTVDGLNADYFKDRYPTITSGPGYRKIADQASMDEKTWNAMINQLINASSITLVQSNNGKVANTYIAEDINGKDPITGVKNGSAVYYNVSRVRSYVTSDASTDSHVAYVQSIYNPRTPTTANINGIYSNKESIPFYQAYDQICSWATTAKFAGWKFEQSANRYICSDGKEGTIFIVLNDENSAIAQIGREYASGTITTFAVSNINSTDLSYLHDDTVTYEKFKGLDDAQTKSVWTASSNVYSTLAGTYTTDGYWHRIPLDLATAMPNRLEISLHKDSATGDKYVLNNNNMSLQFVSKDGSQVITPKYAFDEDKQVLTVDVAGTLGEDYSNYELIFKLAPTNGTTSENVYTSVTTIAE